MTYWDYKVDNEPSVMAFPFFNKNDTGEIVWSIKNETGFELFPFQVRMLNRLLEHKDICVCRGGGRSLVVKGIAKYYAEKEHKPELKKLIVKKLDKNDYTKSSEYLFTWQDIVECGIADEKWIENLRTSMPADVWKREFCCKYTPMSKEQQREMIHANDTFIIIKPHPAMEFV